MLHPLFTVLVRQPELLLDHLAGYAALARQEASHGGRELARRALAGAVAVVAFVLFLALAGMALMLGMLQDRFHWMLLLVPGCALALALGAALRARRRPPQPAFERLRAQLQADARALRTLGAP